MNPNHGSYLKIIVYNLIIVAILSSTLFAIAREGAGVIVLIANFILSLINIAIGILRSLKNDYVHASAFYISAFIVLIIGYGLCWVGLATGGL